MPSWAEFPKIQAPNPNKGESALQLEISNDFINSNLEMNRKSPIFQMWSHVAGQLPPIPNISRLAGATVTPTLLTLDDAVACYRGLERPHDDEANGSSVLVYVLNPKITTVYDVNMVCLAKAKIVPANTVLTVQVRPDASLQPSSADIHGIVTRLEFVSSTPDDPAVPKGADDRYKQLLWRK